MESHLHPKSLGLLTDLYELTMAQGYFKQGVANMPACFHLYFRRKPFGGPYAVVAGLQTAIEYLNELSFDTSDLNYLKSLGFEDAFLRELESFSFACDVDAIEEGRLVLPHEPMVRVTGPIMQAQLLESALLCIINYQTLVATKASRIVAAAGSDEVIEFGLRRAQGVNGALMGARAAFIGGCQSTSNTLAGKMFGIPVKGTMAHSWVMAFESEEVAFAKWAEAMPDRCLFLVDTYDTLEGVKKAIQTKKDMIGVRLDSGDMAAQSIAARKLLDEAGCTDAKIMASNELDEEEVARLKKAGCKIDMWGIGTHLITSKNQPALDGIYKLSAVQDGKWQYKIKCSSEKATTPGRLQIRRSEKGDTLYDLDLGIETEGEDLLVPVFRKGKCVYKSPPLTEMQKKRKEKVPKEMALEPKLLAKKEELMK